MLPAAHRPTRAAPMLIREQFGKAGAARMALVRRLGSTPLLSAFSTPNVSGFLHNF